MMIKLHGVERVKDLLKWAGMDRIMTSFDHICLSPIRIETGRYERLALENRRCFNCVNHIENEEHVLLHCPLYEDLEQHILLK